MLWVAAGGPLALCATCLGGVPPKVVLRAVIDLKAAPGGRHRTPLFCFTPFQLKAGRRRTRSLWMPLLTADAARPGARDLVRRWAGAPSRKTARQERGARPRSAEGSDDANARRAKELAEGRVKAAETDQAAAEDGVHRRGHIGGFRTSILDGGCQPAGRNDYMRALGPRSSATPAGDRQPGKDHCGELGESPEGLIDMRARRQGVPGYAVFFFFYS